MSNMVFCQCLLLLLVFNSHYVKPLSSNKKNISPWKLGGLQYFLPAGDGPFNDVVCPVCRFTGFRGTGLKRVAN